MYCSHCGKKQNGDAKFCYHCGEPLMPDNQTVPNASGQCPNCGHRLSSLTMACPACGFDLCETKSSLALEEFVTRLEHADSVDDQVLLIRSFPISNTKKDILDFMMMAYSNYDPDELDDDKARLADSWLAKFEQGYQKATLLYQKDADFPKFRSLHEQMVASKEREKRSLTRKKLISTILNNAGAWVALILLLIALAVEKEGGEAIMLEVGILTLQIWGSVSAKKRKAPIRELLPAMIAAGIEIWLSKKLDNGVVIELGGAIAMVLYASAFFQRIKTR